MLGRPQPQDIQQQRLVVAFPPVVEEAGFRLPAVRHRIPLGLCPLPTGTAVERVVKFMDFALVVATGVVIGPRRQRASQQESAIQCRQFALPGATAGLHVEKMIVKTLVAGRVRLRPLRAVPEEKQRRQHSLHHGGLRHESAFDADRVAGQSEAGRSNAQWSIFRGLVDH